ncbi:hypothetical protein OAP73_02890 [Methylophilaceae bacterium]|nr:hypothetical protein [Methylophilaceae bacterium]
MAMAQIEAQMEGGSWRRLGDCSSHPADIKRALDAAKRAHPLFKKFRAVDSVTKQLLDMDFQ